MFTFDSETDLVSIAIILFVFTSSTLSERTTHLGLETKLRISLLLESSSADFEFSCGISSIGDSDVAFMRETSSPRKLCKLYTFSSDFSSRANFNILAARADNVMATATGGRGLETCFFRGLKRRDFSPPLSLIFSVGLTQVVAIDTGAVDVVTGLVVDIVVIVTGFVVDVVVIVAGLVDNIVATVTGLVIATVATVTDLVVGTVTGLVVGAVVATVTGLVVGTVTGLVVAVVATVTCMFVDAVVATVTRLVVAVVTSITGLFVGAVVATVTGLVVVVVTSLVAIEIGAVDTVARGNSDRDVFIVTEGLMMVELTGLT